MTKVILDDSSLDAIGDSIRTKNGTSTKYKPSQMSSAIDNIPTGTDTSDATLDSNAKMLSGYTAYADGVKYTGSIPTKTSSDLTASTLTVTVPSGYYASNATKTLTDSNLVAGNIKNGTTIFGVTGNYTGGGSASIGTKSVTNNDNTATSISFSSLNGTPKAFFVRTSTQISSSGSTTYYYVINMVYDGTSTEGNCFRIGSTRRVQNITSGYSYTYSGSTLTVSSSGSRTVAPGSFYNGTYELVYIY